MTQLKGNNPQPSVDIKGRVQHTDLYVGSLDDLGPSEAWIVHHAVAAFKRGAIFWPGVDTLARMSRCHRATVYRALRKLEGKYLRIVRRPGRTSIYRPSFYLLDRLGYKELQPKPAPRTVSG